MTCAETPARGLMPSLDPELWGTKAEYLCHALPP